MIRTGRILAPALVILLATSAPLGAAKDEEHPPPPPPHGEEHPPPPPEERPPPPPEERPGEGRPHGNPPPHGPNGEPRDPRRPSPRPPAFDEMRRYERLGRPGEAGRLYEAAMRRDDLEPGVRARVMAAHIALGAREGRFDDDAAARIGEAFRLAPDPGSRAAVSVRAIEAFRAAGRREELEPFVEELENNIGRLAPTREGREILTEAARVEFRTGSAARGFRFAEAAVEEARRSGDPSEIGGIIGPLSRLAAERAGPRRMRRIVESASRVAPNDPGLAAARAELDIIEGRRGDALRHAARAEVLARRRGDTSTAMRASIMRGRALLLAGERGSAERVFEDVFLDAGDDLDAAIRSGRDLGGLLASEGRFERAVEIYENLLDRADSHASPGRLASLKEEMGIALHNAGRDEEAREEIMRSLETMESLGLPRGRSLLALGMIEASMGNAREAARRLGEAREEFLRYHNGEGAARASAALASLLHEGGDVRGAIEHYRTASRGLQRPERSNLPPRPDPSGAPNPGEIRGRLIELLSGEGLSGEAAAEAERSRMARISALFEGSEVVFASEERNEKMEEASELLSRLSALRAAMDEDDPDRTSSDRRAADIEEIESRYSELAASATVDPAVSYLISIPEIESDSLQAILPTGATLVEYGWTPTALVAMVVSDSGTESIRIDSSAAEIVSLAARVHATVSDPASTEGEYLPPLEALYRVLWAPVEDLVGEEVYIVPDGPLFEVPFAAAFDGEAYLAERHVISILPAASYLSVLGEDPGGEGGLAAFASPVTDLPPLPGAEAEVSAIADIFGGAAIFAETEATETNLRSLGEDIETVHLACHGSFSPDEPLSSAIFLSSDDENDGRFDVTEAFSLVHAPSSVVLSACETGRITETGGDGVVGLTVAFFSSGSERLLASLWRVSDEATRDLMTTVYSEGRPSPVTLAEAQRSLIHHPFDPDLRRPFAWAAFQAFGRIE